MKKKYLNVANYAANKTELYEYLLENAVPKYFDSVSISEDKATITCFVDDTKVLELKAGLNSQNSNYVYNKSGTSVLIKTDTSGVSSFSYVYDLGNALAFQNNNNSSILFVITKDNNEKTVFLWTHFLTINKRSTPLPGTSTSVSDTYVYTLSVENGAAQIKPFVCVGGDSMTCLVPVPVSDQIGVYLPSVYWLPFCENVGDGVLEINGAKYLSNGIFCIKDEQLGV